LFEDTAPLGAAVDREPTRELVINRAVTDIIQRTKAMRAAKSLRTYLEKHPSDEPDEQLLNLLGTSLFVAEQHTAAKGFLEQCAKLYEAQNERLEKTRPGQRRWGIEWMSAREVARKFDERAVLIQNAAELAQQAAAAAAESNHQQEMVNSYYANGARKTTPAAAQAAMNLANNLARAAAAAKAKIPNLPWLTDLEPVLPPMPKGLQVVAADTSDTGTAPSVFTIPTITLHDAPTPPRPSIKEKPEMETPPPVEIAPPPPRKPVHISIPRHALAFAIDKNRLITSAEVVGDIRSVRMENADGQVYSAHVIAKEGSLALLELDGGSGQLRYLNLAESFAGGPVTCTAVPQENVFGPQPVSLTGQAMVPAQGEMSVSLNDHPRLAGSPLLNAQGQIVGVVVAKRDDMKTRLPVVGVSEIRKFLSAHSALPAAPSGNGDPMGVFEVTVQEN
jgi:S1-C subfamily serine protease